MLPSRTFALPTVVGSVLLAATLAACGTPVGQTSGSTSQRPTTQASGSSQPSGGSSTPTSTTPPIAAATLKSNVEDGASKVDVDTLVKVTAGAGKVSDVKLTYRGTDGKGKVQKGTVSGSLSKDKSTWLADDRLEPSSTYKLSMTAKNAANHATKSSATFTTKNLSLSQQTFPELYPLKGSKVGVGMPITLNFDVPVKNKKAFEQNLHVTTTPAQPGTWHWFSDTQVRYRPAAYWKPGTKVSVDADVNGVSAGNGVYGQNSAKTNFTVGRSLIVKVNLATDVAKVYQSGTMVRRILVTAGKPGWVTRSGTKVIMAKEYNKKMTNEMIGAKEKYSLVAAYAMRITNSGEFLHSAPWNTANLGVRNASHGCTGMSNADARWLITHTLLGDPVVTTGTSRSMELDNGYGDWNDSYQQYKKGSAL